MNGTQGKKLMKDMKGVQSNRLEEDLAGASSKLSHSRQGAWSGKASSNSPTQDRLDTTKIKFRCKAESCTKGINEAGN